MNCIRYADDTVLIADTNQKLQEMITALDEECRKRRLRINFAKTEVMRSTKRRGRVSVEVDLHQRRAKQVDPLSTLDARLGRVPIGIRNLS